MVVFFILLNFLCIFHFAAGLYNPFGDEIQAGSVLLPATRRGRYLANIIRRQAVDGTGIAYNKDADRINAESKKKLDVLSDDLLPYIIAEQERRTTLYKRIMTAIQNGEKGVTIVEMRNKPPLIIRKGVMFRCPANRALKEPDGKGTLMCEEDIEPTQIMYDSCLSAEDKDLYVAENKYFFCNRHRLEGPDLPHNGSTVIGCAPVERTSLNYTTAKCALEDSEDVVVHYRYYPDRTYRFVTDLDPENEVCDHWNPCQIGYIFALPSPDQAIMANELWRGYVENFGDCERDEIVPPIPEDSMEEFVHYLSVNYSSSPRIIKIPDGYTFQKLWARRNVDNYGWSPEENRFRVKSKVSKSEVVQVQVFFPEHWSDFFYSTFYAVFSKGGRRNSLKTVKFLIIKPATAYIGRKKIMMSTNTENSTAVQYRCPRCRVQGMLVRTPDGYARNVDPSRFRVRDFFDRSGRKAQSLVIELAYLRPVEYGDFYAIILNGDGVEERIKAIEMMSPEHDHGKKIKLKPSVLQLQLGAALDKSITYECDSCELTDVTCNGESAVKQGIVSIIAAKKTVQFNFKSFENSQACVYSGLFTLGESLISKVITIVEADTPDLKMPKAKKVVPPSIGKPFDHRSKFDCTGECAVKTVLMNGQPIHGAVPKRRSGRRSGRKNNVNVDININIGKGGKCSSGHCSGGGNGVGPKNSDQVFFSAESVARRAPILVLTREHFAIQCPHESPFDAGSDLTRPAE